MTPATRDRRRRPIDVIDGDWRTAAAGGVDRPYLQAGCVVSRWVNANGGPQAVTELIAELRAGAAWPAGRFT